MLEVNLNILSHEELAPGLYKCVRTDCWLTGNYGEGSVMELWCPTLQKTIFVIGTYISVEHIQERLI